MSHNIEYGIYAENVDKKKVQTYWDQHAAHADRHEGCTGLYQDIRWLPDICASEADAYDMIERKDRGNYDQLAVRFRAAATPSAKLKDLNARLGDTRNALFMLEQDIHYSHTTAKFVSCKRCGSALSRTHLKSNFCPMCGNDLRPQSVRDKVARAKEKVKKLEQQIRDEEKKNNQKGKLFWLVKVEYHT